MIRILLVIVSLAGCAGMQSRTWTPEDTAWQAATFAVAAVDLQQTRNIVRDCREGNPIIGSCGQRVSPELFFAAGMLAHTAIAYALPKRWRRGWQGVVIGGEMLHIGRNTGAGYDAFIFSRFVWGNHGGGK